MELFTLKGYGNALNYQMGVPLLEDVVQSMEQAIKAKEGLLNHTNSTFYVSAVLQPCVVSFPQSTTWLNFFWKEEQSERLKHLIECNC